MSTEIKIASIVGARPQFIKTAVIHRALIKAAPKVRHLIIHTGQHYDDTMSQVFFSQLSIPEPEYNLGVGSAPHGEQTGLMLMRIEKVLLKEKPSLVVVYGDTNSTLAGALAAAKLSLKVAHVEAGLRSYVRNMPEEINRVITDHSSDLLFCPTKVAVKNLNKEGIDKGVFLVGDVMLDSLLYFLPIAQQRSTILNRFNLYGNSERNKIKPYLLATVHRAENTDSIHNLKSIISAFNKLAQEDNKIIFPLHPRTQKMFTNYDELKPDKEIHLINPVPYFDMLLLIKNASIVLTDSGGLQKEAYLLKTPCITLREDTEWEETVQSGWNYCVGTNAEDIIERVKYFKEKGAPATYRSLYGDGRAGEKIVEILIRETNE
jgi:UDP-N-acetylglucosamine 2-epimerase